MLIALIVFGPFLGAAAAAVIGKHNEKAGDYTALFVAACVLGLTLVLARSAGSTPLYPLEVGAMAEAAVSVCPEFAVPGILSGGLSFSVNGFRAVYAVITALMWAATTLFGLEYFAHERENIGRYRFFVLFTLGAVEGVMLSADLMTAFVFFEILSFTSFTWVIHEETRDAVNAGYTYLFVAVIGGLLLFMGLILLDHNCGTLSFEGLSEALRGAGASAGSTADPQILAAGVLILLGLAPRRACSRCMYGFPRHIPLRRRRPLHFCQVF